MLEKFRQYEIKNTKTIFGKNQFTLDCPGAPRPIHYPSDSDGMVWCLPSETHENPSSADGYFGRDHGN